jgi:predicted homoserine dehydrogenase-like protein
MEKVSRRDFIKTGTIATVGMTVLSGKAYGNEPAEKTVRVAVVGTGNRGTSHVNTLLTIDGVEIAAVCDLAESKASNAADICEKAGRKRPKIYSGGADTYRDA